MALIAKVNPVTPVLVMTRELITTGDLVGPVPALVVSGLALVALLIGWIVFRVAMPHLIERMSA